MTDNLTPKVEKAHSKLGTAVKWTAAVGAAAAATYGLIKGKQFLDAHPVEASPEMDAKHFSKHVYRQMQRSIVENSYQRSIMREDRKQGQGIEAELVSLREGRYDIIVTVPVDYGSIFETGNQRRDELLRVSVDAARKGSFVVSYARGERSQVFARRDPLENDSTNEASAAIAEVKDAVRSYRPFD